MFGAPPQHDVSALRAILPWSLCCSQSCTVLDLIKLRMVEAAGVEPASEIAVSQESPCCVRFRMFLPHTLRTDKMRMKLVRLVSLQLPGPSGLRQPAE